MIVRIGRRISLGDIVVNCSSPVRSQAQALSGYCLYLSVVVSSVNAVDAAIELTTITNAV
jgi:hypothetical protein